MAYFQRNGRSEKSQCREITDSIQLKQLLSSRNLIRVLELGLNFLRRPTELLCLFTDLAAAWIKFVGV
jgi:hypothetical protein